MASSYHLIELDDALGRSMATEEFLLLLHRSSELLRDDRSEEARNYLEEAFDAQPGDHSGQAALALVYFKLGLYPRALAIYSRLLDDHRDDPVLRLNLALVYFKTGQTTEARDQLEEVVRIAPEYRKAHGYLGLARQRLGDWAGAREAFSRAGADHMADRMARFVEPDENDGPRYSSQPPPPPQEGEAAGPPETAERFQSVAPPPTATTPFSLERISGGLREPVPVSEIMSSARLPEPLAGRFLVSESGYLLVDVASRVYARLRGLHFCSSEGLSYAPLKRRERGRAMDEYFGGEGDPVFEIEGGGRLGFHPGEGIFNAVSIDGEHGYAREDLIFALDPKLTFDHGRIPGGDISLVHLRGRGSIVLHSPHPLQALEVTPDRGVVIPSAELVGWFGRLLPRPARVDPFDPSLDTLEFTGEGILLFCLS